MIGIVKLSLFMVCLYQFSGNANAFLKPPGYHLMGNKCYKYHQTALSWASASNTCIEEGGNLASVMTAIEYNGLLDHIAANYGGQYWISGHLTGSQWLWANGQTMNSGWFGRSSSIPGNTCAYFCSFTRKYWDGNCSLSKKFICQIDNCIAGIQSEIETN